MAQGKAGRRGTGKKRARAKSQQRSSPLGWMAGLGPALRFLRRRAGLSVTAAAAAVGAQPGRVSAYERGRHRPSLETLERLLHAYGADLADLAWTFDFLNPHRAAAEKSARAPLRPEPAKVERVMAGLGVGEPARDQIRAVLRHYQLFQLFLLTMGGSDGGFVAPEDDTGLN